jgi:hypothetical protein
MAAKNPPESGRQKLRIYQLLCHIIIHKHPFIECTETGWLIFRTSDLGIVLKLRNAKMYEYLELLEKMKYIDSYYSWHGITHVKPIQPQGPKNVTSPNEV